jgi:hypothetical protein
MPCRNHFLFLENLFVFLSFPSFLAIIIDYRKEEKETIRVSQGPKSRDTGGRNL